MARPSGGMLLETLFSILLKHTAGYSAGLPLYAAVTGTQSTAQPVPSKGPGEKFLSTAFAICRKTLEIRTFVLPRAEGRSYRQQDVN